MKQIERQIEQEGQDNLQTLLLGCARGDRDCFEELYRATSARMYAVALRLMRRTEWADEVMQEAYVKIWHNASEYISERGSVLTWMTSILRYRAIDQLRRLRRSPLEDDEQVDELAGHDKGPLIFMQQACEKKLLQGCLDELVDNQKNSIALAFFDGLSHEQLSQYCNAPLGTVKSWIRRGLLLLRRCLEENELREPGTH